MMPVAMDAAAKDEVQTDGLSGHETDLRLRWW